MSIKLTLSACWKAVLLLLTLSLFYLPSKVQAADPSQPPSHYVYFKIRNGLPVQIPAYKKGGSLPQQLSVLSDISIEEVSQPFSVLRTDFLNRVYRIAYSNRQDGAAITGRLQTLPFIEFAVEDKPISTFFTPADPYYNRQWALRKIKAGNAWDVTLGNSNIVVAIVDDGLRFTHEDMSSVIWTNSGEIAGNSIDDDANGYIDDIHGWDVADLDNNPAVPSSLSYYTFMDHGTACASAAGAATDNLKGVASIGAGIRIMPVKIKKDADWNGNALTNAYDGITYAIAAQADVISLSWGGKLSPSHPLVSIYQAIIDAGHAAGITIIAAVGNDNNAGLGTDHIYPASLNHVIGVGSSTPDDLKSNFSNYGSQAGVDIMAPGEGIFVSSAANDGAYRTVSGTSLACPFVAGACALILSVNPGYTPAQVESCLLNAATNIDGLNPTYAGLLGAGRLDAELAVQCITNNYTNFKILSSQQVCRNTSATFQADISGTYQYYWTYGDGSTAGPLAVSNATHTYTANGMYAVTLSIRHAVTGVELYKATREDYVIVTDCNTINSVNGTWYFGNQAGVKFSTGRAVKDMNSTLSFMHGSACISDASSNVLFYGGADAGSGNDYKVNNSSHANINTLSGFGTMGNGGSQGGLVLKKPGSVNTYRIFVPSNFGSFGSADGFCYYDAIVGAANNPLTSVPIAGPLGCVSNSVGAMRSQHAITAVQACSSGEYWVIVMTNNGISGVGEQLVVYKFTSTGLTLTSTYTMPADIAVTSGLEASPDGNYLAYSYFDPNFVNKTDVYRFDRTTGAISSFKTLDGGASVLSFSPNSSLLYVDDNEDPFETFATIRQYDIKAVDPNATYQLLTLGSTQVPSGLQLGPDNILYVNYVNSKVLGAIIYPDQKITVAAPNACGYTPYIVELTNISFPSVHSGSGLPNDVDATEFPIDFSYIITNCTDVSFTTPACGTYTWLFGDGTSSTLRSPTHTYTPGTYTVRLFTNGQLITKNITVGTAVNAGIAIDDTRCDYVGGVKLLAQPAGAGYSYTWTVNSNPVTGYGLDYYFATAGGTYEVTVTENSTGCSATYQYNYTPGALLQIQQNTIIFSGFNSVILEVDPHTYPTFNLYTWYRNGVPVAGPCPCPQYTTSLPGDYVVKGQNACGEQVSLPYQLEMGPSCNPLSSGLPYIYTYQSGHTFPVGVTNLGLSWVPNPWYVMGGSIVIPSGATVNITDASLIMDYCSEIVVQPGGVLNINRTNITSCQQWQGITVIGTPSTPRTSTTVPGSSHGQLYMHDCYISDATVGILSDQGGYFRIDQTEFEGNTWHIGMQAYGFPSYNSVASCEFYKRTLNSCINSHLNASLSGYMSHIFFDGCSDVVLSDNTFNGDYLVPVVPVVIGPGPLFSNLAIEYHNAGHMRAIQNRFYTNEAYGIYADNTGPLEVTSNLFEGRLPSTSINNRLCGLYIFNGTNLLSYNNTYRYCYNGIEYYDHTGASSGIDHSQFEENQHGIVAAPEANPLTNTNPLVNALPNVIGLGIHCNKFYNNMNGITGSGDLLDQGGLSADASNMFSGNGQWNILWQQYSVPINYYYGAYTDPALTTGAPFQLNGSLQTATDVNSIGLIGPFSSCYMSWKNQQSSVTTDKTAAGLVKLYPNPNNGNFAVELPHNGNYHIRIINIVGATIYQSRLIKERKKEIQLESKLPPGNYSIIVRGEDVNYIQKFSVVK